MKNRRQQQKVMLLLMYLQKLIIKNPKRILQIIRKIQTRQILKKPMILTMHIRTVPTKAPEPDTVEQSLSR